MKKWICPLCGYEMESETKPAACPVCGYTEMVEESEHEKKKKK
jgi:rubrerythrin